MCFCHVQQIVKYLRAQVVKADLLGVYVRYRKRGFRTMETKSASKVVVVRVAWKWICIDEVCVLQARQNQRANCIHTI